MTIRGEGCSDQGERTILSFQGGGRDGGIIGADALPVINSTSGEFRVTYAIPAELDPLMNEGGGPVIPGTYYVRSYPPGCLATFVVTAGLATTGPGLIAVAFVGATLIIIGMLLRRGSRAA